MIKFYYHPSPNPANVALVPRRDRPALRTGARGRAQGDQHLLAFTEINPNAKTPALVDGDAIVFDSSAILLYLAE